MWLTFFHQFRFLQKYERRKASPEGGPSRVKEEVIVLERCFRERRPTPRVKASE